MNKKNVFSGILFDVYQWDQKLFDGTFAKFEQVTRVPSVQIICITTEEKLLLLKEEQPSLSTFLSLPGGQVDRGEEPLLAAQRELLEETGYKGEISQWCVGGFSGKLEWKTYYYIVTSAEKIQEPQKSNGEHIKVYELSFDEFLNEIEDEKFRNKEFKDMLFRIKHTPKQLESFKSLLFKQ